MEASVTVYFRAADVIPFFYNYKVRLAFHRFCQIVNILYKKTDNADACHVLKVVSGIGNTGGQLQPEQFLLDALFSLHPVLDIMDGTYCGFFIKSMIEHLQPGQHHLACIMIRFHQRIILFIRHSGPHLPERRHFINSF